VLFFLFCLLRLSETLSGAFTKLRNATISYVISVRPFVCLSSWNNSAPCERFFVKLDVWVLFGSPFKNIQNSLKCEKNNGNFIFSLFEIFLILPRMRNILKICTQKTKTHFNFNNVCFRKSCLLWNMWENIVELGRTQTTIRRMRTACWVTKATNTH